jgi:hypothetical protein
MVDYYPLRYTNRVLSEPEEGDEEVVPAPVVDVVINDHRENGKSQTFAVKISVTLPRTKD